jgi:hypothetical protein
LEKLLQMEENINGKDSWHRWNIGH